MKAIKKCKVCGKEYEYCKTFRPSVGFRYQDVACSEKCGSIYLTEILKSRGELPEDDVTPDKSETESVATVSDYIAPEDNTEEIMVDEEDDEEWFDDDLDEDEEDYEDDEEE